MKNYKNFSRYLGNLLRKNLAMKLSFLFFLVVLFNSHASSYAQNKKLTLAVTDTPVEHILEKIEDKSEFRFFYKTEEIDIKRIVSLDVKNMRIKDILNIIFNGQDVAYSLVNKQIVLTKVKGLQKVSIPENTTSDQSTRPQQLVTGTVVDEQGVPLPGANVLEKGTTNGTQTDFDGMFSLELTGQGVSTLVFSYIGYVTQEVEIDGITSLDVTLKEDAQSLDEVVIIGYGSVKKRDLTGSVASVKGEAVAETPTPRIDDALRGKVSGLQITPTSSAPGAAATVRIRGSNSLSANNEPLYVIDGFIGGFNLNDINPQDVESIQVLKDASATAIYGSRGSNGVILITTKRGKVGKLKVTFDTYTGFQSPRRFLDVLNASDYAAWINEVNGSEVYPNPSSFGEGTNWQREIFKNGALMQNYTLSLAGGNEKSRFFLSLNAFDQDGISMNSSLKRYQLKLNSDHQISDRFKIGQSLLISRNRTTPGYNLNDFVGDRDISLQIAGWLPTLPVRDSNGQFTFQTESSLLTADNPVARAELLENINTQTRVIGTVFGEYELFDGLKYKLLAGVNILGELGQNYSPSSLFQENTTSGTARVSNVNRDDILLENTLNFNKEYGNHSVSGLLGYTRQTISTFSNGAEVRGFVTDAFSFNNLGAGTERISNTSQELEEGLESYLFRANYGYKGKYLFTASARLDGSSVFSKNNKWGLFPSAAFAWNLYEEDFIKNLNLFDELKFRTSLGQLGNPGVAPFSSLSQLSLQGNNYVFGSGQTLVPGIAPNTLGNDNLKWETTTQYDIGLDASFFDNRVGLTLDYYNKVTKDLLVQVPLLQLTSFDTALSNFGKVRNRGFELSLNSLNVRTDNFEWNTSFNISTNRNEIMEIDAPEGFILNNPIGGDFVGVPSGILREGIPLGSFYGLVSEGIWNNQEEIDSSGLTGETVFLGGRRYKDVDGDGEIDVTKDRQVIGDANPDFFGGFGNTFKYKNFEMYMYFTFVFGNDIFNETLSKLGVAFDNNVPGHYVDRWTPSNTDSNVLSANAAQRSLVTSNSDMIEDGSFVRLRNLNFSYRIPTDNIPWISTAKVYIQGTNLILFDNYSGYDPEINRGTGNLRRGYDNAQDPAAETYTLGLTLTF
ncbi:TonB-dependent receptor [Flagellimonas marinaquae]|uniref:TonB-dependent receptor n=1 Tax=Flagellimonas marinaquae TaxID=254955 RepID=UPI000F8C4C20|nr:TonB-dependent receptor [Allomuricauda aquimarina]